MHAECVTSHPVVVQTTHQTAHGQLLHIIRCKPMIASVHACRVCHSTSFCCADNPSNSTWAAVGPDHVPPGLARPLQVHHQQLHAHCHLQDSVLLLLYACSLWDALVRHHRACCLPNSEGYPACHGAVLSGGHASSGLSTSHVLPHQFLSGITESVAFQTAKDILLVMGQYFQVAFFFCLAMFFCVATPVPVWHHCACCLPNSKGYLACRGTILPGGHSSFALSSSSVLSRHFLSGTIEPEAFQIAKNVMGQYFQVGECDVRQQCLCKTSAVAQSGCFLGQCIIMQAQPKACDNYRMQKPACCCMVEACLQNPIHQL